MLALVGCGGGNVSSPSTPASTPAGDAAAQVASDANAVQGGNGVTTPSSDAGDSNVTAVVGAVTDGFVFGPYKDVTVNANWNTGAISTKVTGELLPLATANANVKLVTWSFATGECGSETWGGITPEQLVSANVADWNAAGKRYIIATGGAARSFSCGSDAAWFAFLDRYSSSGFVGVDFDIEAGQSAATVADLVARVKAAQANAKYKNLRFSFTIATLGGSASPSLGDSGIMVMEAIQKANLTGYYVNLMAMDYGSTSAANCTLNAAGTACDMGASAAQAAKALHDTYQVPYAQIEVTPMIGGNDTQDETFTLDDVVTLTNFAKTQGLAGIHYWSLDRDVDCDSGYAQPTCNSYGKAGAYGFLNAFLKAL